jgi:hypothetical protein
MTIDSTWVCDLRRTGDVYIRFTTYFDGPKQLFQRQINRAIVHKDIANMFTTRTKEGTSTKYLYDALPDQWKEDTAASQQTNPNATNWRIYASFVFDNDRERMERVIAVVKQQLESFKTIFSNKEKIMASCAFIHSGGKASEVDPGDTAFPWRNAVYLSYVEVWWEDQWLETEAKAFCKEFKDRLRPFSIDERAAFINFPDKTIGPKSHERSYFGDNAEGPEEVKKIWDGEDYFKWPQSVQLPTEDGTIVDEIDDEAEDSDDGWGDFVAPTEDFFETAEIPDWFFFLKGAESS